MTPCLDDYDFQCVLATGFIIWKESDTLSTPIVLELIEYMMGGLLYSMILIVFIFKKRDITYTFDCVQTTFIEWSIKWGMDPNVTYVKNIRIFKTSLTLYVFINSLVVMSPIFSTISNLDDTPLDTRSHWIMYWPKVN